MCIRDSPRGDGLLLAKGHRFPVRIEATQDEKEVIEWRPGSHAHAGNDTDTDA